MDIISFMIVVWFLKTLAEDGWSTVQGRPNPRAERRAARQKSRSKNPLWGSLLNYLGDVAEDAREEAARRRRDRREQQDRDRHQTVDAEYEITEEPGPPSPDPGPEVVDPATPPPSNPHTPEDPPGRHEDLTNEQCTRDICPVHGKGRRPEPQTERPTNRNPYDNTGGNPMSVEINGLDPAIDYADECAKNFAEHGTAGNEGLLGALDAGNVTGETRAAVADAQEASSIAAGKWETAKNLLTEGKRVQEAYDQNPDAGSQDFNQGGR